MVTDLDGNVPVTVMLSIEEYHVMALHAERGGYASISDLLRQSVNRQIARRREEEQHPVIVLHKQGKTTSEISIETGLGLADIRTRLSRLGLTPNRRTPRKDT